VFEEFCQQWGLVDLFVEQHDKVEFTIERMIRGKRSQFRCDLALVSHQLVDRLSIQVAHEVRCGDHSFTDHSALLLTDPARDGPKIVVQSFIFGLDSYERAIDHNG